MTNPYQESSVSSLSSRAIQDAHPDDKGVILVYGVNIFGDHIYSYVETSVDRLKTIKSMIDKGESLKPSDMGIVLAAGRGEPQDEIRQEMLEKYGIAHVPPPWNTPKNPANPVFSPAPKYTFEDDEDE